MEKEIEKRLIFATKLIEQKVDQEIERLESLNEHDIEQIRRRRIDQMKENNKMKEKWIKNDHGKYYEISEEKCFFEECKRSSNLVCHFYRESTFRCKIVDKHLNILANKHLECKFIKIDAEKSPFITTRLNIRVIPTILIVKNEKAVDYIIGFDDLGGIDEFTTEMLEWRIAQAEVVEYSGDLMVPPGVKKTSKISSINTLKRCRYKKTLRDKEEDSDDDNNQY